MSAINKLGTALAISTLTLAMFGCKGQNNSTYGPQQVTPASISSTGQNLITLTPIDALSITDYSLELCIKNTGRKYIEEITALACNSKGIQFLEGIEQLTELKSLHLNFNDIQDISPLVELKKLQTLYLSGNQIQNLDALSELSQLSELGIQKNYIQDLSPLQSMTSLRSLHTHSNQIDDFSILNSLELDQLSGKEMQES